MFVCSTHPPVRHCEEFPPPSSTLRQSSPKREIHLPRQHPVVRPPDGATLRRDKALPPPLHAQHASPETPLSERRTRPDHRQQQLPHLFDRGSRTRHHRPWRPPRNALAPSSRRMGVLHPGPSTHHHLRGQRDIAHLRLCCGGRGRRAQGYGALRRES